MISKSMVMTIAMLVTVSSFAAEINRAFEKRIVKACVKSAEKGKKNIQNYKEVCKCVGETHYSSAAREVVQAEANEHINWVAKFYETSDMKVLQKMVDQNPKWSSFDDQVVDDCMLSINQGPKK